MTPSGPTGASAPAGYPVTLEVIDRPCRFQRRQVLGRLLCLLLISLLAAFAWLVALIYLALPVLAAGHVSRDRNKFLADDGPRLRRWLHWLLAFDAYFALLTDRFPSEDPACVVRYEVQSGGRPTVGTALLRLLYSLPSALALLALALAGLATGIVAGVMILVEESYPDRVYRFHLGVVRWGAWLLAYHASLVDRYPPFGLNRD